MICKLNHLCTNLSIKERTFLWVRYRTEELQQQNVIKKVQGSKEKENVVAAEIKKKITWYALAVTSQIPRYTRYHRWHTANLSWRNCFAIS